MPPAVGHPVASDHGRLADADRAEDLSDDQTADRPGDRIAGGAEAVFPDTRAGGVAAAGAGDDLEMKAITPSM
jgi:hypothetical protein